MIIIPQDRTIEVLLLSRNERFAIPSYQRRYAWRDSQTTALFEDIDMLQRGDGHLFGMLILHTGDHQGGVNDIDVVDGQQRLTTITLLLNAIRMAYGINGQKGKAERIANLLVCGLTKEEEKPKVRLGELDDADYQRLLKGQTTEITNPRLLQAHVNFTKLIEDKLEARGAEWLDAFVNDLLYQAKIIRLDVQQARDAYKLFETINNRGLRLSATDILKNFILGHAAKIGDEKLREVKEVWSKVIVALDGIPTDDFFRQYISSMYTRKITKSRMIGEFKAHYYKNVKEVDKLSEYNYNLDDYEDSIDEEDEAGSEVELGKVDKGDTEHREDIVDYLKALLGAATTYGKIWNATFEDVKLNKLLSEMAAIRSFPTYIFLMHYLQWDRPKKERYRIIKMLSSVMLRRHICSRRTSENDDIFAKLLRVKIADDYRIDIMETLVESCPENDEFLERFATFEHRGKAVDRAKYILRELEYDATGNTGELTVRGGSEVHLEHIIPQTITTKKSKREFGDWEEYLGEKAKLNHRKYVQRIGNMTLLAGVLNISASNNPFTRKKRFYRKSNIQMTSKLGELKNFKFKQVDKRGLKLGARAVEIWALEEY